MKYAVEMGSATMICRPSFIKNDSAIEKLMGRGIQRHKDSVASA
jgi:hypothetical protein